MGVTNHNPARKQLKAAQGTRMLKFIEYCQIIWQYSIKELRAAKRTDFIAHTLISVDQGKDGVWMQLIPSQMRVLQILNR